MHLEKHARQVRLASKPLGSGGEAAIFELRDAGSTRPLVAKIYHKPQPAHFDKLTAMIANPPVDPMVTSGHVSIAWPLDRVLSNDGTRHLLGFIMPRVEKARPLFDFYNPRSRLQFCPLFHYGYLIRTAGNLASAVAAVHERGYVVGDLNESNVLVNNKALVTLVDTDSFQVPGSRQTFRCPVGKPEYTAPELQGVNFADVDRLPEHDRFALGILIFQILMQGIHPFAGRYTGPKEPADLAGRISNGHWPYCPAKSVPYEPNPHAPPFAVLPKAIQELLRACFMDGHRTPGDRPTAGLWKQALDQAETLLVHCRANAQHVYPEEGGGCPWCLLAKRQKRDPFPSQASAKAGVAVFRPAKQNAAPLKTKPPTPRPFPTTPAPAAAGHALGTPYTPLQISPLGVGTQPLPPLWTAPKPRRPQRSPSAARWRDLQSLGLMILGAFGLCLYFLIFPFINPGKKASTSGKLIPASSLSKTPGPTTQEFAPPTTRGGS